MSMSWLGIDPGGKNAFGVALLNDDRSIVTTCVSCAQEALDWLKIRPAAAGIDSPMWWSAGLSGDRQADQWLRRTYGLASGTVQAANSLRGAALVQAALFAEGLRQRFPDTPLTYGVWVLREVFQWTGKRSGIGYRNRRTRRP